jgi:hypothetical protein
MPQSGCSGLLTADATAPQLDDGDDPGRSGLLQTGQAPPGGLDALLGAVGQDQGDDGAQRRADEEPDDGDHQRRGGQSLGLWALTQSFASTCRSGFHSSS